MTPILMDLRYAARGLAKSPAFTLIATLTLAIGVGGNTAIFSVVNSVIMAPLPYDDPDELVVIGGEISGLSGQGLVASPAEYRDYSEQSNTLASLAAAWTIDVNITTGNDRPFRSLDGIVTTNFMRVLGVRPMLGRDFEPEDAGGDIGHVVILSYNAWQRFYGGDPDVIGTMMLIDDDPIEIIGVMPAGFKHPGDVPGSEVDTWGPVDLSEDSRFGRSRNGRRYTLFGRLKPRVETSTAQAEFLTIAANLREEYPESYPLESGWSAQVVPLMDQVLGGAKSSLFIIFGSVGFVLLIACTNVANLLLARGTTRAREIAIRSAVGGGRAVIARQFLLESLVLGIVGGALGLVFAYVGTDVIKGYATEFVPRLENARMDWTVLLFTLGVSIGTSTLFGLIPAIQLSKTDLQLVLKEGSGGVTAGGNTLRNSLVVAEMAVSLTLLVGAGLLLKSYSRLMDVERGFQSESVMTFRTFLPWTIVPEDGRYFDGGVRIQFYDEAVRQLEALPNVRSAGVISRLPLRRLFGNSFSIEGGDITPGDLSVNAETRIVGSSYFEAMSVPLIQGRLFSNADMPDSPRVVLVNQAWVDRYSPDQNPIGRRLKITNRPNTPWREIVGTVGNVKHHGLDARARETIYSAYTQGVGIDMTFVIETTGRPEDITRSAVAAINTIDPTLPVFAQISMDEVVAATVAERKLVMVLLSLFAGLAIVLAAIGIYGVISQAVTQRTREIGIRMALGAESNSVMRLVLREGLRLALVGVVLGAGVASVTSRVLSSMLYTVGGLDPLVFGAVAVVAISVAGVATLIPAVRATRVDPLLTMKAE
jgi:putative ABC transport system permease protein